LHVNALINASILLCVAVSELLHVTSSRCNHRHKTIYFARQLEVFRVVLQLQRNN